MVFSMIASQTFPRFFSLADVRTNAREGDLVEVVPGTSNPSLCFDLVGK